MTALYKDLQGSCSQCLSVVIRERSIASFDKIIVEGSVGVLWRTDGHLWEIKVVDGVGGDGSGDGILLPLFVGLANQDSSRNETTTNYKKPQNLCIFGLRTER